MSNSVLIVENSSITLPPTWDPPKRGINLYWDTWDGRRYNLSDYRTGIFMIGQGLEGLGYPEIVNYERTSPSVHGSAWDGWVATGRKVFWTVGVYHDGTSEAWIKRNRDFLKSFRPGTKGRWTVELPTGERLQLSLRYKSGLNGAFEVDPAKLGWQVYGIEFIVEQPFWEGDPIEQFWEPGGSVPWAGVTGFGPPWNISSSRKLSSATLTNPGEVDVYPEWELQGPFTSASFGLNGRVTPVPFELKANQSLVIQTDPRTGLTALLNGVDVMDRLPGFAYTAVPPGEDVQLSLALTGDGGKIFARFRPLYFAGV